MSYVKTTWVTGDIVTATKLNNLESGVEANDLNKLNKPSGNGTAGQLLISNGDGSTSWTDTDTTLEESGKAADAKATGDAIGEINEALETKAEIDGYYEDLTSGNAEQLLSDNYTENTQPYLYRQTGGNSDRECLDKIVGGTLNWNQLVRNGNFADGTNYFNANNGTLSASNGVLTYTPNSGTGGKNFGASSAQTLFSVVGHKYLYAFNVKVSTTAIGADFKYSPLYDATFTYPLTANVDTRIISIASAQNVMKVRPFFYPWGLASATTDGTETCEIHDVMVIDLTAMFGTTIADYVYGLEQATTGSGVAWLKKYINLDKYHAYSAPTLKSVEGLQSHDTVGFNLWDGEWEDGEISSSTGQNSNVSGKWRSKNYIPVFPSTGYYAYYPSDPSATLGLRARFYDADKNYIGYVPQNATTVATNRMFVTPANAYYMRFAPNTSDLASHDICLNVSCSRNGSYEPYQKRSYPLDSSVVLRGYPMLVDGRLKFDGDEYLYDGTIAGNFDIVDLGTLNWTKQAGSGGQLDRYYTTDIASAVAKEPAYQGCMLRLVCPLFISSTDPLYGRTQDKAMSVLASNGTLYISASGYESASDFKTAMNGVQLVYRCAVQTISAAEPFRQLQICDNYGTEEFVTTSEIPVGTETRYPENLKAKVEGLPWDLSMIAPIEDGTTASKAYTTGQYFLHNNVFCKAKTSIASGATFTLNTNYEETDIATELYTALH